MGGYVERFQVLWCIRTVEGEQGIDSVGGEQIPPPESDRVTILR